MFRWVIVESACMLRVAISEEETDKTESMAVTQTEILEGDEGCCHRTSGGLAFAMTILRSKGRRGEDS